MMGYFLARFWLKKKTFLAVKRPQFSLPRHPRDVFWSPLSGKNRFGPGSTKKMTRPTSFSDQFSFFWSFLAPCDPLLPPFLALKWPWDPSKKIWAEISYPTMPVWRQETPWVRFYGQISEKASDLFLAPSSWYSDHSVSYDGNKHYGEGWWG